VQVGLIGGIGPAATDYYYRSLIAEFANRPESLDLTIVHADTPTLLGNLERNDIEAQVAIYSHLTDRLASAGAECVAVTSIAGHFCIDHFKKVSPLHVVDMLLEVNEAINARAFDRVGILGTRTVMETRFYSAISTAEVIPPGGSLLDDVHSSYVAMAASGRATNEQRAVFDSACEQLLREASVDAIMLGGTDLALVYAEGETVFPVVDCAAIHVDAIVRTTTG
jgi:aspartate racemase